MNLRPQIPGFRFQVSGFSPWIPCVAFLLVFAVVAGLVGACSLDNSYSGMGDRALPGDPLNPHPLQVECHVDVACQGGPGQTGGDSAGGPAPVDLTGRMYRFDSLAFEAPLTGLVGQELNKYFAEQIEQAALHVLLEVQTDDRDTQKLVFRVGPGTSQDGSYELDGEPALLECEMWGSSFSTVTPASMAFPNDALTPPQLPISALSLTGDVALDGTSIQSGNLVGGLTEEDAESVALMGPDLKTLLTAMVGSPDMDTNNDGIPDAWKFVGEYTALEVPGGGGR